MNNHQNAIIALLSIALACIALTVGIHIGLLKEEVHEAGGIAQWHIDADGLHCIEQLTQQGCSLFAREYFMSKHEGQ